MPIRFTCPYCGWTTDVADRYVGRSGDCAACGKAIEVPAGQDDRKNPCSARRNWMPVPAVFGLLVLLVVGSAAFFGGMAYLALKPSGVPILNRNAQVAKCAANMQKISSALGAYVAEHGHFPPAYTTDEGGVPLHSWRVLILPYLGYEPLYEQLKLDEPWNSKHNSRFASQMPLEYHCPADPQAFNGETSYVVIEGPGGFPFNKSETISLADMRDGATRTLIVVETTGLGLGWMQPSDVTSGELEWAPGASVRGIGSQHADGRFLVLTADGSVSALDADTTAAELRALATIAGGEAVYPVLSPP